MAGVPERGIGLAEQTGKATPLPYTTPGAYGAGLGAAIGAAGAALHQDNVRADRLEKKRQDDAELAGKTAEYAEAFGKYRSAVRDLDEQGEQDGTGLVDNVRAIGKATFQPFLESIKSETVRRHFAQLTDSAVIEAADAADVKARAKRSAFSGKSIRQAGDEWDNQFLGAADVETLTSSYAESMKSMDHTIDTLAGSDRGLADKAREDWTNTRGQYFYSRLIDLNPALALESLHENTIRLDPKDRKQLIGQAEAGVHSEELKQERAQRAVAEQARSYLTVLGKRFDDGDPTITDNDLAQATQLAKALGDEGKAYDVAKWRTWRAVDTAFRGASALQISQALRPLNSKIEQAGEHASPDDVIRRDRLQTLLEHRQAQEHEDPLGVVDAGPLDFADPSSIRSRVGAANAARGETGRFAFFTPQELPDLREELASGPGGKLDVINKLASVAAVDPQAALRGAAQIDPQDRTLRHAMRVAGPVREMIVRGAAAKATLPSSVVGPDGKSGSVDTFSQDWFAEHVAPSLVNTQPEFAADVLETSRAIYADWRRRAGVAASGEEFNADQFRRSVNLALGGMNGRGGLGDWQYGPKRGDGKPFPFVLPARMTEDDAERRFGNPAIAAGPSKAPPGSVNGTPVWASGKPMSQFELTRKFVPVAIADGVYQFRSGNNVVMTAEHRPFQVDIRKLDPIHSAMPHKSGSAPRTRAPDYAPLAPPKVRGPVWVAPGGEN